VNDSHTLTARWVFPVSAPPLERGTVTVRGETIEAVEPRGARTPDFDLGNRAIVPGLVNAHTHLDLSGARGLIPPTDPDHFTDWLRGVIAYRRARTPEQVQADIRAGLGECLKSGTTLIGDIAAEGSSWDALANANARAVVFFELIGLGAERLKAAVQRFINWAKPLPTDHRTCRVGHSPHAPYSAAAALFSVAVPFGLTSTTHLAETRAEADLLERAWGPFVPFLQELGLWDKARLAPNWEWVVFMSSAETAAKLEVPILPPVLFAHANYLSPDTRHLGSHHTIVYCPRTHAAFGHPPHPFREFLARGVRVCLGTDSLASNPDLDILAEARFVRSRYPDFSGAQLLRMVTLTGAEALGWEKECGSLEPGKSADLIAVPLANRDASDPHELLLGEDAGERRTMFRGAWRT
jgi:cytosine/adenosine deaminase-related metal-dependent hydrolase